MVKRLFYDIETSPCLALIWRPGYKLNIPYNNVVKDNAIICICYKWEGDKKVHYLKWENGDDKKLIKDFIRVLDGANEIIAHNGDGFDMPWIRMRAIKHGLLMPHDYPITDTLKLARRRSGRGFNFNSNRLDALAKFLGVGAKIKTTYELWESIALPIFLNLELTPDYYRALKYMVKYCKEDVRVLEKVYNKLAPYVPHKYHQGVKIGGNKWDCPECGGGNVQMRGVVVTKVGTVSHRVNCKDCHKWYSISTKSRNDRSIFLNDLRALNAK